MAGSGWNNQLVQLIILTLPGGFTGIFGYSPAPGPGNLVISISAQGGTDPFGNTYPPGITVGPNTGAQVQMGGTNPATLAFPLNNASIISNPQMYGFVGTAPVFGGMDLDSAKIGLANHLDFVEIELNSPNLTGTSSANLQLDYFDNAGAAHLYAVVDYRGTTLPCVNQLDSTDPTTGTSALVPAISETWHGITLPSTGGFSGVARIKKMAQSNFVLIDIQVRWTVLTASGFTGGNLPSASYYPTVPRTFSLSVGDTPSGAILPTITVPTSGGMQWFTNASGSGSGTASWYGGTFLMPLD